MPQNHDQPPPPLAPPFPDDDTWFWSPQWQARLAEAEADRLTGNSTTYASEEQFLASFGD